MNIPWTLKPFDIDSLFNPSLTLTSCALCDESCFAPTKSKHITYCEACIEFMESEPETGFEALRILGGKR